MLYQKNTSPDFQSLHYITLHHSLTSQVISLCYLDSGLCGWPWGLSWSSLSVVVARISMNTWRRLRRRSGVVWCLDILSDINWCYCCCYCCCCCSAAAAEMHPYLFVLDVVGWRNSDEPDQRTKCLMSILSFSLTLFSWNPEKRLQTYITVSVYF